MSKKKKNQSTVHSLPQLDLQKRLNFLYQASFLLSAIHPQHRGKASPKRQTKKTASIQHKYKQKNGKNRIKKKHTPDEPGQDKPKALNPASSSTAAATSSKSTPSNSQPTNQPIVDLPMLSGLSRFYAQELKSIGSRAVLKLDPNIKRSFCKRCLQPAIPGYTCIFDIDDSNYLRSVSDTHIHVSSTCKFCHYTRSLPMLSGKLLASEQEGIQLYVPISQEKPQVTNKDTHNENMKTTSDSAA